MSNKKNVAVLGAGVMGTGIAQLFASKGYPVTIIYVYDDIVRAKPLETMQENLKILCDNDVMREDEIPSILENVTCTEDMEAAAKSADIIFECIVEDLATKQEYFKKLDEICAPETILATNTSVISVTEIAEKSIHKERIIGTHFWKPAYIIPLVEVVKTEHVSEKVVNETFSLLQEAGKKPVIVQDAPGFALNRIQLAVLRECLHIVEQGIATPEAVDDVMKYGLGMRYACLGPFEVCDLGGLDIFYNIASYLFEDLADEKAPFGMLADRFEKGQYGVKTAAGFYDYAGGKDAEKIKYRDRMFTKISKCLFNS